MNKENNSDALLLVLKLNLKKIQKKPLSKQEEESLESTLKNLGLSLEQALKEAYQIIRG